MYKTKNSGSVIKKALRKQPKSFKNRVVIFKTHYTHNLHNTNHQSVHYQSHWYSNGLINWYHQF